MNEYLLKGLLFIFIFYISFVVLAKNNFRFIYWLSVCYSGFGDSAVFGASDVCLGRLWTVRR